MRAKNLPHWPYLRLLPLGLFLLLALLLASGLFQPSPAPEVEPMVGRELPNLTLPQAENTMRRFGLRSIRNEVAVISLFASWCEPCVAEHAAVTRLAREGGVRLFGIAWRDGQTPVLDWLSRHGNPYQVVMLDERGVSTTAMGVRGVPETYVVGRDGTVAYKHSGPLTEADLRQTLLPLIAKLKDAK